MGNISEKPAVYNAHFRMNGLENGGSIRGVERVMLGQNQSLQDMGYQPFILTGETDSTNLQRDHVVVVPSIRMDPEPLPRRGDIVSALTNATEDAPILFHNTTKPKHNLPYCQAASDVIDSSVRRERRPAVLWVHDIDRRSPLEAVHSTFPTEEGSRLAVISSVRMGQLHRLFDQFSEHGLAVPNYDMRLIPNPIEAQFLQPATTDIPKNLRSLAPEFSTVTETHHLPQSEDLAERILFGVDDYTKFILPGCIAHNKGVKEAIDFVEAYGDQYNPAALIITNFIEMSTPANRAYFGEILSKLAGAATSSRKNFEVLVLGGVERKYMRWLLQKADMQVAPYENEGFSLPPFEAALSGVATAFSEDPAMLETTEGHGLVLPMATWQQPLIAARSVNQYMGTSQQDADVAALSAKARRLFHPDAIGKQVRDMITP